MADDLVEDRVVDLEVTQIIRVVEVMDGGIQGPPGPPGPQGPPGEVEVVGGSRIWTAEINGEPEPGIGVEGDYLIDTVGSTLYGPKNTSGWGPETGALFGHAPQNSDAGPSGGVLGSRIEALVAGRVTALRFYRAAAAVTTSRAVKLWSDTGTLLAEGATSDEPLSAGWITVPLATPVLLAANDIVRVAYDLPPNDYYTFGSPPPGGGMLALLHGCAVEGPPLGRFPDQESGDLWADIAFEAADAPVWPVALYGFPNAPADGKLYAREWSSWAEVRQVSIPFAVHSYNDTPTEPPGDAEVRFNADRTKLWISNITPLPEDRNIAPLLGIYGPGMFFMQDSYHGWVRYRITGKGIPKGGERGYYEFPITSDANGGVPVSGPDVFFALEGAGGPGDPPDDSGLYAHRVASTFLGLSKTWAQVETVGIPFADYAFSDTMIEPPGEGEVRFDSSYLGPTKLWISNITAQGLDVAGQLGMYGPGKFFMHNRDIGYPKWTRHRITGPGIAKSGYYEFPVSFDAMDGIGPLSPGQRVLIILEGAGGVANPPDDGRLYARRGSEWVPLP